MNIVAANLVWERAGLGDLSTGEIAVLLCIARRVQAEGISWPSHATMMSETALTKPGLKKILLQLEAKHLVVVKRYVPSPGQARRSAGYLLIGDWIRALAERMAALAEGIDAYYDRATQLPYQRAGKGNSVSGKGNSVAPKNKEKGKGMNHEIYTGRFSGKRKGRGSAANGPQDPHAGLPDAFVEERS